MAILGKLIVNIDADLKGLRNQIKAAESVMRQSAKSLGGLASTLSQSISLPLAGIGVGAISAAADMERLTSALSTTMEAAGRSTASATKELELLRQAALAPGLDFEQAVKGSVRLQNVGFSAEKARGILVQLANAVAITGGQAQELDGVTRQFSQMIAKGRILQEDLSIIQENMPAVSVAMEKAFGTKSAERLREMGVSAEQFIDGVTKALGDLPRVTGGLSNSIVNAFSAMKQAAAQVGEVINQQFGISDKLNEFATFLGELAKGFQEMSGTSQAAVLGVAAFALALGPHPQSYPGR
jgi:tape measure domain-containing protein